MSIDTVVIVKYCEECNKTKYKCYTGYWSEVTNGNVCAILYHSDNSDVKLVTHSLSATSRFHIPSMIAIHDIKQYAVIVKQYTYIFESLIINCIHFQVKIYNVHSM